jgi:hypothetical protein
MLRVAMGLMWFFEGGEPVTRAWAHHAGPLDCSRSTECQKSPNALRFSVIVSEKGAQL